MLTQQLHNSCDCCVEKKSVFISCLCFCHCCEVGDTPWLVPPSNNRCLATKSEEGYRLVPNQSLIMSDHNTPTQSLTELNSSLTITAITLNVGSHVSEAFNQQNNDGAHFSTRTSCVNRVEQRHCLLYTRRSNMACHVKHDRQRQHDVTHAAVWDLEQAAAQRASARSKQGRQAELCQASPETGGGLGGGPFVGEVAGEDSLSFATSSSPTCTNTHTVRV